MRNKGKVHPSSSSSVTPSPFPVTGDSLSVLNLLPAAILTLAVVLSVEDREVLAYMITRSIRSSKKGLNTHTHSHKSPVFECDCFDCYTSYWFRWDTSPNRELIHQAIEAFEENLTNSEQNNKKKGKKKEKITHRRFAGKPSEQKHQYDVALVVAQPEIVAEAGERTTEDGEVLKTSPEHSPEKTVVTAATVTVRQLNNRGVGRKVVPDVIGLLNWRLWNIWSPNV